MSVLPLASFLVRILSSGETHSPRHENPRLNMDRPIKRGGTGPRGALATLSQYMLSSAATFSFFLAVGSVSSRLHLANTRIFSWMARSWMSSRSSETMDCYRHICRPRKCSSSHHSSGQEQKVRCSYVHAGKQRKHEEQQFPPESLIFLLLIRSRYMCPGVCDQ